MQYPAYCKTGKSRMLNSFLSIRFLLSQNIVVPLQPLNLHAVMKKFYLLTLLLLSFMSIYAAEGDTIKITFNGTGANVDKPTSAKVTSSVNGAYVTLRSSTTDEEYVYDVYGSTTAGSLTIVGSYKLTLRLNGVDITSGKGAAIDVECGKRIAVELAEGSVNTLTDYAKGTQKAAFYTTGHPEFSGAGTLNVTGNVKHAISAKEYLQIKKTVGTINVLSAVSDGIHCGKGKEANENNYFQMNGGTLNISNVGGDCIDSDDYGTVLIKGGTLNLTVSADDVDGIKADSTLTILNGDININVTGKGSSGIKTNWLAYIPGGNITVDVTGDGSKGIRAKQQTAKTVNNGGSVTFSDSTDVKITASGASIYDTTGDETKCMGMSIDADLLHTGGSVYILAKGDNAYTYQVKGSESTTIGFRAEYEKETSVAEIPAATGDETVGIFSVSGTPRSSLQRGINIIKKLGEPASKIIIR